MKYIKIAILCSIFTLSRTEGGHKEKVKDGILQPAARELHQGLNVIAEQHKEAFADFGKNMGTGALNLIGAGLTGAVAAGKVSAAAALTAAQAAALTAAPFVPPAAIATGLVVVGYGGYKIYRSYHPTEEEMLAAARLRSQRIDAENNLARQQREQRLLQEQISTRQRLTDCFRTNRSSAERAPSGYPAACGDVAYAFAMATGSREELDKMIKLFNDLKS